MLQGTDESQTLINGEPTKHTPRDATSTKKSGIVLTIMLPTKTTRLIVYVSPLTTSRSVITFVGIENDGTRQMLIPVRDRHFIWFLTTTNWPTLWLSFPI